MIDTPTEHIPEILPDLLRKSEEIGFTMPSDAQVGALLRTLVASKPHSHFLELGTGIGLSLCWLADGMDPDSKLTSIDNDKDLIAMAETHFGEDARIDLVHADGSEWIQAYRGNPFDLIFADAWPGKYSDLQETLDMLHEGGFYVVDDMDQQPNWPEGHQQNVDGLLDYLEQRTDFFLVRMDWSTGLVIAVKKRAQQQTDNA